MNNMQDLRRFVLPSGFRGRSPLLVQIWWLIEATAFRFSPQFMYGWRRWLLRLFGAKIGRSVLVRPTVSITYPWKVTIGDNSWVGDNVVLYSLGEIRIGCNSVISQESYLCAGSHDYTRVSFPIVQSRIVIEDECWLATDVYVAPGVTIGRGTVVGARSSVFKDLPPGKVCYGNPAKVGKERLRDV